jgi:hypothetical protein
VLNSPGVVLFLLPPKRLRRVSENDMSVIINPASYHFRAFLLSRSVNDCLAHDRMMKAGVEVVHTENVIVSELRF